MSLIPDASSLAESRTQERLEPPFFLITIDTEGDNIWSAPREITTRNANFLERFQHLCEQFHFKPTYLVNYEMAMCPEFRSFGRSVLSRKAAEIGMHLHAWNAPPIEPLVKDDYQYLPFLIEYPEATMRAKIAYQTNLLADIFGVQPVSHRAGRWALDQRYVEALIESGYRADCSVTPGVSWRVDSTQPFGSSGTDYRSFPCDPYWMNPADISRPGSSGLLEVPMSVWQRSNWSWIRPHAARAAVNRFWPETVWLRPNGRNQVQLRALLRHLLAERRSYAEFMLHSSELMPGGSPTFRTREHIERLYSHMRRVFEIASANFTGATLQEYSAWFRTQEHVSRAGA